MFNRRFRQLLLERKKRQTIRKLGRRNVETGDAISLRCWTGAPYRSRQEILFDTKCEYSTPVSIDVVKRGVWIEGSELEAIERNNLAIQDGFANESEFFDFFERSHGVGIFFGRIIEWN